MRKEFSAKTKALAFQRANGRCEVDDCSRPQRGCAGSARVCHLHYQRWAKYGTTQLPDRRKSPTGLCLADGCRYPVRSANAEHCETHYYRLRRDSPLGLASIDGRHCRHCGVELPRKNTSFCSKRCQYRYVNGTPNIRPCAECGKDYEVNGRSICCSSDCAADRSDRLALAFRKKFAASPEGKEYLRQRQYLRRARREAAGWETFSRTEIFERDGWKCGLCGKKVSKNAKWPRPNFASIDHIIPLARGGSHTRKNVQTAHLRCNISKNAREIGQLRIFG